VGSATDAFYGQGGIGVNITAASLSNTGTIVGGYAGNGTGGIGVYVSTSGIVTNFGTISGGSGYGGYGIAVSMASGTLVIEPGAVFDGQVLQATIGGALVELSGSTAATLTGLGTQFLLDNIAVDGGAFWTIADPLLSSGTMRTAAS
jgi:hypothetical protein